MPPGWVWSTSITSVSSRSRSPLREPHGARHYNEPMLDRRKEHKWPAEGATRVPYWVYQDQDIYREEQQRIFHGPTWSYLCLEAELPEPGSFVTTFVGEMPLV